MKINFTKAEYRLLLDMLYIADWMIHAHDDTHSENKEYKTLRKKILSYCKEMGLADKFHFMDGEYYETGESEFELHEKFIDDYNAETFWSELIDRLSTRDFVKESGLSEYEKMEPEQRIMGLTKFEERYADEFSVNGIENLKLSAP